MKKTALFKTSIREIGQSKTRFLSILGIIFLGVMVFVGLKATGPDMTKTATNYFNKEALADVKIISSLGLTDNDIEELKKNKSVKDIYARYTKDIQLSEQNIAVKFIGYDTEKKDRLNQFLVVTGRMPEKSGEVVLDSRAQVNSEYKIGDSIELADQDDPDQALKQKKFTIVGFVQSPEYIENMSRGSTTVGKGSLDFFAVVPVDDLSSETYSEILVSFHASDGIDSYSSSYKKASEHGIEQVKEQLKNRGTQRVDEIRAQAKSSLEKAQEDIATGEATLKNTQEQLDMAKQQLDAGTEALAEAKQTYIAQISSTESQLNQNNTALKEQETQLSLQKSALEQKEQEVNQVAPQIQTLQATIAELNQQLSKIKTAQDEGTHAINSYQSLGYTVAISARASDADLAESITNAAPQMQEVLTALGTPEELNTAVNQLIEQPTRETIAGVMAVINATLQKLTAQEVQLTNQYQLIDQQVGELTQKVNGFTETEQQISVAKNQVAQAEAQLATKRNELAVAQQQFQQAKVSGQVTLDQKQAELNQSQQAYEEGMDAFEKRKEEEVPKLSEAKKALEQKQAALNALTTATYYYFSRSDNPGYSEYEDNANRIASLATVFPVFFFLIAALVSLTTMTRMVEEKRIEIGSLKALGYRNSEIAFKFLLYATAASLCGAFLGLIVGYYLFPTVIFNAYGQLYNIPDFVSPWYLNYSILAVVVAILCTVGASMVVLRIDLYSTPALLLRPKTPKAGRRILLERIKPLWNRLSFVQKVTSRNLFRYKQRMLMTVLGIAGCMALIITGFGLKDSISDIVTIQFNKIFHYQAIVSFKNTSSEAEISSYQNELNQIDGLSASMPVYTEQLKSSGKRKAQQDVSLYVPEAPDNTDQFILFTNRQTGKTYQLKNDGVIINEKLANLFDYKVGDTITFEAEDGQAYQVKIAAIAENYTGHFAYMTPTYYQEIFNKAPAYNKYFLLFDKKLAEKQENMIAKTVMSNSIVSNITFLSVSSDALTKTINSLNIVVWVLIVVSGLLAFIVLYNLTNINISERIRELSTIKVLGFYDREVTMYVYRENIILTLIGILIGCFLGKIVHGYVLQTVEVDRLMFSPTIHWISYVYSSVLTFLFALFVMIFMHQKLKKVDMIEALKSNE